MISQRSLLTICVLLVSGIFLALCVQFFPYILDDSYITFRYASNLAAGSGLVFNPNEYPRSEGLTSPFYGILLGLAILLGANVVVFAKMAGVAAIAFSGCLIYWLALSVCKSIGVETGRLRYLVLTGPALFLCSPFVVANAVSGMETAFATLAVLIFLCSLYKLVGNQIVYSLFRPILVGVTALLVPMLRPEMGLFIVIACSVLFSLLPTQRKVLLVGMGAFVGLGIVYFLLRFYYYGLPLPLPFYIKQGAAIDFLGAADVGAFLTYIGGGVALFVLSGYLMMRYRRLSPVATSFVLALIVASVVQLAYYATLQHIMGFGFRYFIPVMAVLVTVGTIGFAMCVETKAFDNASLSRVSRLLAIALVLSCFLSNFRAVNKANELLLDWYGSTMAHLSDIALQMRPTSDEPVFLLALNDCGIIPFTTSLPVLDLGGLNNRNIAFSGMTAEAAQAELVRVSPDLVFLVSTRLHGIDQLYGWERLNHSVLEALGYVFKGSIEVGENYFYIVYERDDAPIDAYISRLVEERVIIEPP